MNGLTTRHRELINTAIRFSFHPHDLIKLSAIKLNGSRRTRCGRFQRRSAFGQGRANGRGQFSWLTVYANMHVERGRFGSK
jgi:hypothetical protein